MTLKREREPLELKRHFAFDFWFLEIFRSAADIIE